MADEDPIISKPYRLSLPQSIMDGILQLGIDRRMTEKDVVTHLVLKAFDAETADTHDLKDRIEVLEAKVVEQAGVIRSKDGHIADLLGQLAQHESRYKSDQVQILPRHG